jgi:hypothetical protein
MKAVNELRPMPIVRCMTRIKMVGERGVAGICEDQVNFNVNSKSDLLND